MLTNATGKTRIASLGTSVDFQALLVARSTYGHRAALKGIAIIYQLKQYYYYLPFKWAGG